MKKKNGSEQKCEIFKLKTLFWSDRKDKAELSSEKNIYSTFKISGISIFKSGICSVQ